MQRHVYIVCGFNGFNQFTDIVNEKNKTYQSPAPKTDRNQDKNYNDGDEKLFFVNPTELKWNECLLYSWSSVYVLGGHLHDYRRYGFSSGDEGNSPEAYHFILPREEALQQPWIRLEYPDCPRGFGFHCIDQIKWNIKDNFYLMSDKGVFEARGLTRRGNAPERCEFTLTRFTIPERTVVQSLSCGKEHVLLVTSNGNVFSFGSGSKGQLGIGSLENRDAPTIIEAFDLLHIKLVIAGGWHSLALTNSGDVYSWGWNQSGQLGIGCYPDDDPLNQQRSCTNDKFCKRSMLSTFPVLIDCQKEVVKVSCGARHSAAIFVDNTVWTWGWNGYGQLGLGDQKDRHCPNIMQSLFTGSYIISDVVCNGWNTLLSLAVTNG